MSRGRFQQGEKVMAHFEGGAMEMYEYYNGITWAIGNMVFVQYIGNRMNR